MPLYFNNVKGRRHPLLYTVYKHVLSVNISLNLLQIGRFYIYTYIFFYSKSICGILKKCINNLGIRKKELNIYVQIFNIEEEIPSMSYKIGLYYNTLESFDCLFIWSFSSNSRIFHSYGDVTIASEGLQILTCARRSWPLSSEGSLACHTYCDTWHPFIMVISEDPWHSHLLLSV